MVSSTKQGFWDPQVMFLSNNNMILFSFLGVRIIWLCIPTSYTGDVES